MVLTHCAFPASFNEYCEATFGSDALLKECYHRKLRMIPAEKYLATFASDRRHMKRMDVEGEAAATVAAHQDRRCNSQPGLFHRHDRWVGRRRGVRFRYFRLNTEKRMKFGINC